MALPPPTKTSPEPVDTTVTHEAAVKALERILDASLAGKLRSDGKPIEIILPRGDHSACHEEIIEHYLAAGWSKATIADRVPGEEVQVGDSMAKGKLPDVIDPRGFVLTLTP